jgi:hypothetical protein
LTIDRECASKYASAFGAFGFGDKALEHEVPMGLMRPGLDARRRHMPNQRARRKETKFSLSARNSTEGP